VKLTALLLYMLDLNINKENVESPNMMFKSQTLLR